MWNLEVTHVPQEYCEIDKFLRLTYFKIDKYQKTEYKRFPMVLRTKRCTQISSEKNIDV